MPQWAEFTTTYASFGHGKLSPLGLLFEKRQKSRDKFIGGQKCPPLKLGQRLFTDILIISQDIRLETMNLLPNPQPPSPTRGRGLVGIYLLYDK